MAIASSVTITPMISTMSQPPPDFSGTLIPGHYQPFLLGQARRPPQYAFFHNEGSGYLHSQYLGAGIQGTATLVRCCQSGQLVVRKRTLFEDLSYDPFSDQFVLPHPNIVQLLAAQNYFNEAGFGASATYWRFANGKDLKALIQTYRRTGQRVPEILVWHFLSQILRAYFSLFVSGMVHRDGHWANVLVHWDAENALPDFILGDLGMADFLSQEILTAKGRLDEPIEQGYAFRVPSDALDLLQGPPTFQQLYEHDEDEENIESYHYAEALEEIGEDLRSVSGCMVSMMHDDDDLDNVYYSEELRNVAVMVSNLGSFTTSRHVRTLERLEYLLTQVRCLIEDRFANCLESTTFPVPGLEGVHPAPAAGTPMLFESVQALHSSDFRPPGPWYIASVDPDTYEVLELDSSTIYCLNEAACTNSDGAQLVMEFDLESIVPMEEDEGDSAAS